jgi:UDP-N-acetylglucosamine 2-epimerase (non-hydrolysing)
MPARKLVIHVVGARPNYMKIAPVYEALSGCAQIEQRLVHTGQHYDAQVKDVFFDELPLPRPHVELEVGSASHGVQTARALSELERVFVDLRPDLVVAPGDVNSTLAAALAAVKLHIPVCHVESGLRSFDWTMPEEHNRRLTDQVSSLLLTHSADANQNLVNEGIPTERIGFVGNTMIDTLLASVRKAKALVAWRRYGLRRRGYLLVTLHRPRLVDSADLLRETMAALERVARRLPVVFPVHPRTLERLSSLGFVASKRLVIATPLAYHPFLSMQAGAAAVVTDSGGVQEETTALRVPCFTLRENTERPVTVTDGTNVLLGLDPSRIDEIPERLEEPIPHRRPPLWDGRAGERAGEAIRHHLGLAPAAATDLYHVPAVPRLGLPAAAAIGVPARPTGA